MRAQWRACALCVFACCVLCRVWRERVREFECAFERWGRESVLGWFGCVGCG